MFSSSCKRLQAGLYLHQLHSNPIKPPCSYGFPIVFPPKILHIERSFPPWNPWTLGSGDLELVEPWSKGPSKSCTLERWENQDPMGWLRGPHGSPIPRKPGRKPLVTTIHSEPCRTSRFSITVVPQFLHLSHHSVEWVYFFPDFDLWNEINEMYRSSTPT